MHTLHGINAIDCPPVGEHSMLEPSYLNSLRERHADALERLRQLGGVTVVYSADPASWPGVVDPSWRARSFKSYEATAGHIRDGLVADGFTQENVSALDDIAFAQQLFDPEQSNPHIAWINTAGVQGECPMSQTPCIAAACGIPTIGHPPDAYTNADNKITADALLRADGLPVPTSWPVRDGLSEGDLRDTLHAIRYSPVLSDTSYVVLKPEHGRGSVGVMRVRVDELTSRSLAAYQEKYGNFKIDEFINGPETTVSVAKDGNSTVIFPPLLRDIDPETGIFASLDSVDVCGRAHEITKEHDDLRFGSSVVAALAYNALRLSGLARIDVRFRTLPDGTHLPYIIDNNPKPDLGTNDKISLTEIAARTIGLSFTDILEMLILMRLDQGTGRYHRLKTLIEPDA